MLSGRPSWLSVLLLVWLLQGCASRPQSAADRPFVFGQDSFAYANELVWEYSWDGHGRWRGKPRSPPPDYSHHCFVVVRAAKQFFNHALFDPDARIADDLTYRRLVRQVLDKSPRTISPSEHRIRIPGYPHLNAFSADHGSLLKAESGGAWLSYLQRGNWRMILPFSRGSQESAARKFLDAIAQNRPAIAHVVAFPSLRINHAVLVFDADESAEQVTFHVYDPNSPEQSRVLVLDRASRTFHFPANDYFPGGNVNVYEVYHSLCY
jgi:hypothetical protein